jgi:hypothetical protein
MAGVNDVLLEVSHLLTRAAVIISDGFGDATEDGQARLVAVSQAVAVAQHRAQIQAAPPRAAVSADPESEDERIERKATEASDRVTALLQSLQLRDDERAFARGLAEDIVDLVTDAYVRAAEQHKRYDSSCITAAVAAALIIVHDAPDNP